jgi:hypothetical protein
LNPTERDLLDVGEGSPATESDWRKLIVEHALNGVDTALAQAPATSTAPRWRHLARGTTYTELGRGKLQASTRPVVEGDEIVAYRGDDGAWWFRERGEFEDGRFERMGEKR